MQARRFERVARLGLDVLMRCRGSAKEEKEGCRNEGSLAMLVNVEEGKLGPGPKSQSCVLALSLLRSTRSSPACSFDQLVRSSP